MQIELSIKPNYQPKQKQLQAELNTQRIFTEQKYRWLIVSLMGISLILLGIINNAIIPLQHKMSEIYELQKIQVTMSIILSFLVFILMNFPANYIIDTKGLRVSLLIGTGLCTASTFLYTLVNKSYYFVILGTVIIGIAQPFLLNCPAKVAALWFIPKNRPFATAIVIGLNIFGMGLGFLIPTLVVRQDSTGQQAKQQVLHLYIGYFIFAASCLTLTFILMKAKPNYAPSKSAEAEKLTPLLSFKLIKSDRNLWRFFLGYFLIQGTFICFGANTNFIMKPFDYTDIEIAVNAIILMTIGTIGAITGSLYIKKTFNYRKILLVISLGSTIILLIFCLWLSTVNEKFISTLIMCVLGFIIIPIVPICYDLGCELSFPIGQAQIVGLLNGGAFLWAFISSSFVSSVIGFGSKKSSLGIMLFLSIFIFIGAILFFLTKIKLKRSDYEKQKKIDKQNDQSIDTNINYIKMEQVLQLQISNTNSQSVQKNYDLLIQENAPKEQLIML